MKTIKKLDILIIEPFFTGSHKNWIQDITRYSTHAIHILTMPGIHWKWRMHGGCVTLAKQFLESNINPDLVIVSDMLDLSGFLALTRKKLYNIPVAIYFHENQLTYPWSPKDRDAKRNRDKHYTFINYLSALSADYVLFNSHYHKQSFISALPGFLQAFPDYNELKTIDTIDEKSSVLQIGLDLKKFDTARPPLHSAAKEFPLILWNHRWEYDKNPQTFFNTMIDLSQKGSCFNLAILGEQFDTVPKEITSALSILQNKITTCGYAESFNDYAYWLWNSDIIPVTNIQEFFGISVMEALYCECIPVLPRRLTYPELIDYNHHKDFFYENDEELFILIDNLIDNYKSIERTQFRKIAEKYDWSTMIQKYDSLFSDMTGKNW